mmetsp:Transcript_33973/g.72222  ORF Transcript_33973/g.72222 Transcript_33973/m.72222 type:complete len:248 (+) Transcript_33973:598-1341(+)
MLLTALPLAHVLRLLRSVGAMAVRLTTLPLAVVDIATRIDEAPPAVLQTVPQPPLAPGAVREDLLLDQDLLLLGQGRLKGIEVLPPSSKPTQKGAETKSLDQVLRSGCRATVLRALVHPTHSNTLPPFAGTLAEVGYAEDPDAMPFPALPLTRELPAVRPEKCSLSFLYIVDVLALISATVRPFVAALPVHQVVHPLALVLPLIFPSEGALSLDLIIPELAVIDGAIGPLEPSLAVLLPMGVGTNVL